MKNFWDKVDKFSSADGCWLWVAGIDKAGYGKFNIEGRCCGAHRVSAFLAGMIPAIKSNGADWVLHICDNPRCVNPDHFFIGDHRANMDDMVVKRRHCFGERNNSAKMSDVDVATAKVAREMGARVKVLAGFFNMAASNMVAALKGHSGKLRADVPHDPVLLDKLLSLEPLRPFKIWRNEARVLFAKGDVTRGELCEKYDVDMSTMSIWLKGVSGKRKPMMGHGRTQEHKDKNMASARLMWDMGLFNTAIDLYEEFKWRLSWEEVLDISTT